MIRAIFSGLLLVFMSYGNVVANQYAFQQLTTKDGLAFNNVDHIYQDKDGILYFCTNNGLSTFDGTEFKTYNSDRFSELSNKIFDIQLIGKNKILIGTMDKGIFILDKVTEKISKVNLELKGSSINPSVSVFHTDKNGFIWIGCFTGEIYLVKLEDLISPDISEKIIKCDEITCDGASSIHSFFEYKEQIYIGTNTDIIFSIRRFENNYFIEKSSSIAQINHIYCYSNRGDSLLLGTDKGLFYFFDNKADCTNELIKKNLKESQIRSIIKHENNSYWIGTQNNGLYNLEYGKKEIRLKHFKYNPVKKNSINSNYIISLFIDTNENLWIGTWFGGANMLNLKNKPYNYIYDSKNENDIHSNILWSINKGKQGQYWIGSHGNGLCSYSINDANFYSVIKNENIQSIKSLYNDTISKRLFIGTWGNGIRVLDNKTLTRDLNLENQFTELKDERIYSIANDNKGTLWIGGFYNGLYSYSYSTGKLTKQSLVNFEMGKEQNPDVRFVLPERGDSSMWIGSHLYGLYKVKIKEPGVILENRYFSHFSNTDEKININSLYQAKNGTIWILTGNGLGVIDDKEDTPKKISILNGINCKFMTEDNSGKLWIATFVGLFRLNTQTNKLTTIFGNTSLNNIIYDKTSNSLLACSDNGLLKINLDTVESKAGYPTIFLSSLRIFDKEVAPFEKIKNHVVLEKNINYYDKISLPYFCNSFSVDIRAINPGISNKSIISYKLTGIEQGWNNRVGTSALATFTNLSSGKYELLVKVASSNQNWNPEMRKVVFIIQKAWWFSNIAIFGYFIIIVIILVIILKEIRERVRVKQKLKMEMIEHKRDHDFYEQKLAIFTNISHDIRTPLTLIKGPVEDLINDDTININQKNKLLRIYKNSELLLKLITQILDFRKIDTQNITLELKQINISNLFQNIFNQFKEQADKKHIDFEIELPEDDVFLIADPEKLESILYNLLSNALKFTPLYGNVFVEVIRREKKITLLVKDTCIGIPNKEIHSSFKRFVQFKGLNKNQGT
ncbi:MAG: ATP-binding protein [Draconibacterium sp.]|nr:ATP-binding protein [Draconibacterium sp.]